MAERTDQRTRDRDVSVDVDADTDLESIMGEDADVAATETDSSGGIRERFSRRIGSLFSVRIFGIALVLTVVLAFVAGGLIPFVPDNVSGLLGVFLGGFALGVASSQRRYLEVGAATLMTGALTALLSNFTLTLLGAGVPLVAFGAGASGIAGILGHYVGRDLRAGLTRDLE